MDEQHQRTKTENADSVSGPIVPAPYRNKLASLKVEVDDILDQYTNGVTLVEIADSLGVHPANVSRFVRSRIDAQAWMDAKEDHYETLLDRGLIAIRTAEKDRNLAGARESYLRRAEWRASVEHSRWQQQRQPTIAVSGNGVTVQLVSYTQHDAAQQPIDVTSSDVAE